jgi:hypothetical protein
MRGHNGFDMDRTEMPPWRLGMASRRQATYGAAVSHRRRCRERDSSNDFSSITGTVCCFEQIRGVNEVSYGG